MKKVCLSILTAILTAASVISPVRAAESGTGLPEVLWQGDYSSNSSPRLNISLTVPGSYTRQITAVIYPKDAAAAADSFIRLKEITADGGADASISFAVSDKFASDKDYALSVNGNGYEAFSVSRDIYVLNPTEIRMLLPQFNSADSTVIGGLFTDKVKSALSLSGNADDEKMGYVLQTRNRDFGGSFGCFNDVRGAWCAADVIALLNSAGATADNVKSSLEKNAEWLSIDMTSDANYSKYGSGVFTLLLSYARTYNNGNGASTWGELKAVTEKSLAVTVINASSVDNKADLESDMLTNLKKYQSVIGIDNQYMTKFNGLSSSEVKSRVLRQLYNKSFKDSEQILSSFKNAVDNPPSDGGNEGGGNSGGGNGGGGGGGSYSIAPGIEQKPQKQEPQPTFSDIDDSHWAARYVSALAAKGIVSGYEDGSFVPDGTVTREEFVKMIVSAAGLYSSAAECEFDDVGKNEWYYRFVASAVEDGIINGTDDSLFGTGREITRQDVAVIAARVLERLGRASDAADAKMRFGDSDMIEEYAKESVAALSYMGILNGFEDMTFRPAECLSRAQAAKIIYMILDKI